jgi:hypothetical protein
VRNWAGADSFCRGGGMNLLKMETAHENNLIYNQHTNSTPAGEILNHRFFLHNRNNKIEFKLFNVHGNAGISKDIYWTTGRYCQEGKARWE